MALAVPLSRFPSRVCGGSAFYVRCHRAMNRFLALLGFVVIGGFLLGCASHQISLLVRQQMPEHRKNSRDYIPHGIKRLLRPLIHQGLRLWTLDCRALEALLRWVSLLCRS